MFWFRRKKEGGLATNEETGDGSSGALDKAQTFGQAILPVIACGAGLFSDGYINNVGHRLRSFEDDRGESRETLTLVWCSGHRFRLDGAGS